MLLSLDISLKDPLASIDISEIAASIQNDSEYQILKFYSKYFVLIKKRNTNNFFRIHQDGRIFVKNNFEPTDISFLEDQTLLTLFFDLKELITKYSHLIQPNKFEKEINVYYSGVATNCTFWMQFDQIKKVGKMTFNKYEIKTFSSSDDLMSVKIQACNSCS